MLRVVDSIPAGQVLTYGDVAELVGSRAPRAVGAVLYAWGHDHPWQRVVMADGSPAPSHRRDALLRLRRDATPLCPDGERVDLGRARWDARPQQ